MRTTRITSSCNISHHRLKKVNWLSPLLVWCGASSLSPSWSLVNGVTKGRERLDRTGQRRAKRENQERKRTWVAREEKTRESPTCPFPFSILIILFFISGLFFQMGVKKEMKERWGKICPPIFRVSMISPDYVMDDDYEGSFCSSLFPLLEESVGKDGWKVYNHRFVYRVLCSQCQFASSFVLILFLSSRITDHLKSLSVSWVSSLADIIFSPLSSQAFRFSLSHSWF